ncbi:MAG: tRNA (adenosine(37)-N6)-dimethylallyltransferase MiaA [Actinobacteria bacterium]|nr:tRNA (adenosine(37)-N6)-dimethylallyltransferase MiaA [Actinomycetota bacterium]
MRPRPAPSGAVLALFGPTASGKSRIAQELAERTGGELVSADSMQAYRGLPILTNQPERPTRLVGVWALDHEGSVGEYADLAHAAIDEVLAAGRTPIVVGGTGLYLRAALAELELPPAPEPGARERSETAYDALGPGGAHALLAACDPGAAAAVHPNDRRRVVRALELAERGGPARRRDRLWEGETRHPTHVFGLELDPAVLERRIVERAQLMFEEGVEAEVRRALTRPISAAARRAIGIDEIASLPPAEALAALVVRTRRFAAYQRKWQRRIPGLVSVRADRPAGEIADEILEVAGARERLPARRAG